MMARFPKLAVGGVTVSTKHLSTVSLYHYDHDPLWPRPHLPPRDDVPGLKLTSPDLPLRYSCAGESQAAEG